MEKFIPLLKSPKIFNGETMVLVYHNMDILVVKENRHSRLPDYNLISSYYDLSIMPIALGIMDGVYYSAIHVDNRNDIPVGTEFMKVRHLYKISNENLFYLAGFGHQIADWDRSFRFCGKCGANTVNHPDERAKLCPNCGHVIYPKISPAVICSVTRGDEILLARGSKFSKPVYSVLAGFVEPGETLEETVKREIMEETSITVKNIKYFGNQPWPFSSSMMMAFTADYASGEIKIDNKEIIDAAWYKAANLPLLPTSHSIAHRLIMNFVDK